MGTKLYGLVTLAVGALMLGPARAQSNEDWIACMESWADVDPSICDALRPPPEPEPDPVPPLPQPDPDPVPPLPQPDPDPVPPLPQPDPDPVPPLPQPDPDPLPPLPQPDPDPLPPLPQSDPDPVPPLPPAPQPDACANGKHSGHGGYASGNATGHRCADGQRGRDDRRHHGRRGHGYRAKAKAVFKQFLGWCQSWGGFRGGRH